MTAAIPSRPPLGPSEGWARKNLPEPTAADVAARALRAFAEFYAENPDAIDDETPGDLRNEMRRWADEYEAGQR